MEFCSVVSVIMDVIGNIVYIGSYVVGSQAVIVYSMIGFIV